MATGNPNWQAAFRAAGRPERRQYTSDVPVTTAHLLSGVDFDLAHVERHVLAAQKSGNDKDTQFNLEHAKGHLDSAIDHAHRLTDHLKEYYPKEGHELHAVSAGMGLHEMDKPGKETPSKPGEPDTGKQPKGRQDSPGMPDGSP